MKYKTLVCLFALLTLLWSGCSVLGQATPTPLPTVVLGGSSSSATPQPALQNTSGGVTASGVVAIARSAKLGFMVSGEIKTISIQVGDQVKAGQVLAVLSGDEQLQSTISAVDLALLTAQQDLKTLNAGAKLATAQANLAVVTAQKALSDAKQHRLVLDYRASAEQIAAANAGYILAKDEVNRLQSIYNSAANRPDDDAVRALALSNLEAAKNASNRALYNLNWFKGSADPKDIADADAKVAIAQAVLADAQARQSKLNYGPDPDQVTLIQTRIKNAQDQAVAVRANLDKMTLKAPFDGTIITVAMSAGEIAAPGQVLFTLIDDGKLHIETTDLSERDIPKVTIGQPVTVLIKPLNQQITGHVSYIAHLADTIGGDVVYKTTITLDSQPVGLRQGMSVTVAFEPSK